MEQKRETMIKRKNLKKKEIKIEDNLIWNERRMKWNLKKIARQKKEKKKRVWIGYGKIQIERK